MMNPLKFLFQRVNVGEVWQRDDSFNPSPYFTKNQVEILEVKDGYVLFQHGEDNMNIISSDSLFGFKFIFTKKSDKISI